MPRPKKNQAPQTPRSKLEAALIKHLSQEAVDSINELSENDLRQKLVDLAQHENETETAKKEDEDIERLTNEKKEAEAPYKDTLKGIKLQRHLIAFRLEEMGKA